MIYSQEAVSIPLNSFIFCWIAFGGLFEAALVWSIFFSNTIIKFATTLVSLPAIYLVKEKRLPGSVQQQLKAAATG